MKRYFFLLIVIYFLNYSCKSVESKEKFDFTTKTLPELIRLGYDLRNNDTFPEICRLLNDSILEKKRSFGMLPCTYIEQEVDKNNDTVIINMNWGFRIIDHLPLGGRDIMFLYVDIKNGNILVNKEYQTVNCLQSLAKDYIFNSDSMYWDYTKKRQNFDLLGDIEYSIVTAIISIDVQSNGLSLQDWSLFFESMHQLSNVYENKQNELALQKWNQNFNTLPLEKKIAINEVIFHRIWLYFKRDI